MAAAARTQHHVAREQDADRACRLLDSVLGHRAAGCAAVAWNLCRKRGCGRREPR